MTPFLTKNATKWVSQLKKKYALKFSTDLESLNKIDKRVLQNWVMLWVSTQRARYALIKQIITFLSGGILIYCVLSTMENVDKTPDNGKILDLLCSKNKILERK